MIRTFARRMSQTVVPGGEDRVVAALSLPSDSVIHDIRFDIHLRGAGGVEVNVLSIIPWAVEAWLLPVLDPDAGASVDAVWDTLVPKDTDVATMDLDTGSAVGNTFYEAGEANWNALFDVGLRAERLYHRHGVITALNNATGLQRDPEDPWNFEYYPTERIRGKIGKRLRVRQPTLLAVGVASPSGDDTTTSVETVLGADEWGRAKYLRDLLTYAMHHVLGLGSASNTPWDDATELLQKWLDPDVYEETAGSFANNVWNVYAEMVVDFSVVGELALSSVSSGR